MKIAILGFGTVGRNVFRLLENVKDAEICRVLEHPGRITEDFMTSDPEEIFNDPDIGIVVDALPGIHPSYEYIKKALNAGKHVVSSNKAAICFGFSELTKLAESKGAALLYEASCGGGIPIIEEILRVGSNDSISRVSGILNGTCNYMLWKMEKYGMSYEEALREAQALGYAEADPTADVSGFDVRNKILILSSLAYDSALSCDVPMMGIEQVTKERMEAFRKEGKCIKLMGISVREGTTYAISVCPVVLPDTSLEANVASNFNIVSFTGDHVGELKLYGQGAGGDPTADAVIRDIKKILLGDAFLYERKFENILTEDASLLRGTCHVGDRILKDHVLSEALMEARAQGCFFAFEP